MKTKISDFSLEKNRIVGNLGHYMEGGALETGSGLRKEDVCVVGPGWGVCGTASGS